MRKASKRDKLKRRAPGGSEPSADLRQIIAALESFKEETYIFGSRDERARIQSAVLNYFNRRQDRPRCRSSYYETAKGEPAMKLWLEAREGAA